MSAASRAPAPGDPNVAAVPLLARGSRFEGVVCFRGEVTVAGHVVGKVVAPGRLELAASGRVDGDIEVDEAVLAGTVCGSVRARRSIALAATAEVEGDVEAPRISVEEGGRLQGQCRMAPPPEARSKVA